MSAGGGDEDAGQPREDSSDLDQLDYYTLLDVAENATREEIRRAFRKFALRYHPDRFSGDAGAGRALMIYRRGAEAVDVLTDPAARAAYDAVLAAGETRLKSEPSAINRAAVARAAPKAEAAPKPTPPAPAKPARVAEEKKKSVPPAPTKGAKADIPSFARPSAGGPRASVPRQPRAPRASKRSMPAVRAAPKAAAAEPQGPKIKSPQARAFFDRARAATASGDLRTAWRMLKAAVDAEPDNPALERELYAVERQFRP